MFVACLIQLGVSDTEMRLAQIIRLVNDYS